MSLYWRVYVHHHISEICVVRDGPLTVHRAISNLDINPYPSMDLDRHNLLTMSQTAQEHVVRVLELERELASLILRQFLAGLLGVQRSDPLLQLSESRELGRQRQVLETRCQIHQQRL